MKTLEVLETKNWDKAPVRLEKISDLVLDWSLYPRKEIDHDRVRNYARSLNAGIVFPTIKIGLFKGKKIIVDGVHRVRAHELNQVEYIGCSELPFDSAATLYAEAVKLNATHGKSFTEKELKASVRRLQKFKFNVNDIQKITSIPAADIHREFAAPIISLTTPSGKKINCKRCNGQPNIHELLQFKNALQLIRDVARKGCIPADDAYFKQLIKQCREALQKVKFDV